MVSESVYLWLERPEVMMLGSETDTVRAESLLVAFFVLCLSGIISLTLNSAELSTVFIQGDTGSSEQARSWPVLQSMDQSDSRTCAYNHATKANFLM